MYLDYLDFGSRIESFNSNCFEIPEEWILVHFLWTNHLEGIVMFPLNHPGPQELMIYAFLVNRVDFRIQMGFNSNLSLSIWGSSVCV